MMTQADIGDTISSELKVRRNDAEKLLNRLASGEDSILEVSMYITIKASTLEELNRISFSIESFFRQLRVKARRCRKEMKLAFLSSLPTVTNHRLETYTFDSHSYATLLPFTNLSLIDTNGIIYGFTNNRTELVMFDRFSLPNPNMIVIGKAGYGKSMFSKIETARQIIQGAKGIIIDYKNEWKPFCDLLNGKYYTDLSDVDLNHHLVVLGGDQEKALSYIWKIVSSSPQEKRVLVVEEFHNILRTNPTLVLQVVKEIRKTGTAPTLITQNLRDFLITEEGKMIMDNTSIKIILHQGENDMKDAEGLLGLTEAEKMFLMSCEKGVGYLYADNSKAKIEVGVSNLEMSYFDTSLKITR
jgi:type IV secretory pathway VirB4 component